MGLGRYILTTEHTVSFEGNLGIFESEQPWGPWHQFHWEEVWEGDDPDNRLYLPGASTRLLEPGSRN